MRHLASVMFSQPSAQIVGDPDVVMFGIETFENVDVFHYMPLPLAALPLLSILQGLRGRSRCKDAYVADRARRRPSGYGEAAFAVMGLAQPKQAQGMSTLRIEPAVALRAMARQPWP